MTGLDTAPTPEEFAQAWATFFERVVIEAAGRDGRLSRSEARAITRREDALRLWADNVDNFFTATGQKSVSVPKLIAVGYQYALHEARKIVGDDGRISLVAGHLLTTDLSADFFFLRGEHEPRAPQAALDEASHRIRDVIGANGSLACGQLDEVTDLTRVPRTLRQPLRDAAAALGNDHYGTYAVFAWDLHAPWHDLIDPPVSAYMVISTIGQEDTEEMAHRTVIGFAPDGTQVMSERC